MNRQLLAVIAAILFAAQMTGTAQASTLSYSLTLTPILGPEGGTGSFTITTPPVGSSGVLTQANAGLTAMDFKIDGLDFGLNSSSQVSYSYQGSTLVLAGLFYGGAIGSDQLLSITLGGTGGYSFTDDFRGGAAYDTIGSISVAQTPIPSTLPLLATGLCGLAMIGLWRKRKVVGAKPALAAA